MSRRDLAEVKRINDEFAEALARGDGPSAWRLDEQLHFAIYDHCWLAALTREIRRLWVAFPWAGVQVRQASPEEPAREHLAMLEALASADEARIQSVCEQHVLAEFRSLVEYLGEGSGIDPFEFDLG